MAKLDSRQNSLFRLFLGARLDHHDAVLVADDHDVDRGGGALGIGGVDDELAFHAAHAHCAHRGAEGNVTERQSAGGGVDAHHVGIVLLVGGEDQGNQLGLVAEALRKERAQRTVDLPAGQHFFFAGPAFALDEAAGNASAGVGVLAVIHGKGEKIDAFPGVGRGYGGGQNDGFARAHQCGARGLLGHAPRLKDQPLATGKLDGYFMLRHRVLVSLCSLGKLVLGKCRKIRRCGAPGPGSPRTGPRPWGGGASHLGTWETGMPEFQQQWRLAAHNSAPSLAAGRLRQVHHGPRSCVERGP